MKTCFCLSSWRKFRIFITTSCISLKRLCCVEERRRKILIKRILTRFPFIHFHSDGVFKYGNSPRCLSPLLAFHYVGVEESFTHTFKNEHTSTFPNVSSSLRIYSQIPAQEFNYPGRVNFPKWTKSNTAQTRTPFYGQLCEDIDILGIIVSCEMNCRNKLK